MKCPNCQEDKPETNFYPNSRKNRHTYCKKCHCIYTKNKLRFYKDQCKEYKGGKCQICGYDKCRDALDFHHLDGSKKEYNISSSSKSFNSKKSELDKCILLCANCHREVHANLIDLTKFMVPLPEFESGLKN